MLRALSHNGFMIAAIALGATATGMMAHMLANARGALGPLVLGSDSAAMALVAVLASVGLATGLGIVMARMTNSAVGLFVLGGVLFGLAWRTESVDELARSGSLLSACAEDILWAALLAGACVALFRFGGPLPDVEPDDEGRVPSPFTSPDALRAAAAGLAVLPVVWLFAQTTNRGQLIGAALCGGMAAGLIGRLIAPHVQPVVIAPAVMIAAALGHAWVGFNVGDALPELARDGAIPALARPMPVHYAAGAAMGVAIGLGWAKSFLHHEE